MGIRLLDFHLQHVEHGNQEEHQDVLHARERVRSIAHTVRAHPPAIPVAPTTPPPAVEKRKQLGRAIFRPSWQLILMASSFTTSNPHRGNQEKNAAQPISIAPAVRNRQAYWCNQALEPGVSAPLVKRLEQPVCHSARQPRLRAMHKLFTPAGRLSDQPAQERLPPRPRCRCATCGARKHQISRSGFLSLP